ncbi:TraR/DksA family transcriptional regulator [Nitrospina watsonii]|nr:TraR/DksA C4-type zinc finger protein [Nitrospina watsonii]
MKAVPKPKPTPKAKPAPKAKATPKPEASSEPEVHKEPPPRNLDPLLLKIRGQLIHQRNELMTMIKSSQEVERNVGELTFSNEIDLASSLEGREMAFQLSSRERNELKMIEEALFKMAKGTYGVCEGCSKNIPVKRLQIMPLTPLCIECQENLEVS